MKDHEGTPARRPLEPDEVLRVMDAAQVIHERQAALREHESFDREAAIRDIQVMYEDLGDLVERDVIEKALDEYLSQRYAFRSPPRGPRRTLALLYVRRGRIARRVLLPAAGVAALGWAGFAGVQMAERRAEARTVRALQGEVAALVARNAAVRDDLDALVAGGVPADLPPDEAAAVAAGIAEAGRRLEAVDAVLAPLDRAAREDITAPAASDLGPDAERASQLVALARQQVNTAAAPIERHARFGALRADVQRLHAAVLSAAIEDLALERAAELGRFAEAQLAARDVEALGETVGHYDDLYGAVASEYRLVITGGVWRQDNDDPRIRNNYLLVEALDPDGRALTLPIRNEETGATARVATWGERVPRDVYDRVAADKQDNGIIDDDDFGLKRRGFITVERGYPDIGQITRW